MNITIGTAPASQNGAALVVGLILLLVLTVLAVSGMSTATFELTMAGNTQYAQNAFQNAETGIEVTLQTGGFSTAEARELPFGCPALQPPAPSCTTTTFEATTAPFDGAYSIGSFSAYHFDIESVGSAQRNAQSTHTQGFYIIGPSGGSP